MIFKLQEKQNENEAVVLVGGWGWVGEGGSLVGSNLETCSTRVRSKSEEMFSEEMLRR